MNADATLQAVDARGPVRLTIDDREVEVPAGATLWEAARELGAADGDLLDVASRRGRVNVRALASDRVLRGSAFLPFHFREAAANLLTIDALDPDGKIPEFKYCAVRIARAKPGDRRRGHGGS